jgi:hypothetical protein
MREHASHVPSLMYHIECMITCDLGRLAGWLTRLAAAGWAVHLSPAPTKAQARPI